jgi:hypothetical protein
MPQYRPLTQNDNRLSLSIKRPVSEGLEWISSVQADGSPGNLRLPSRNLIRRGAPFDNQAQSASLGDERRRPLRLSSMVVTLRSRLDNWKAPVSRPEEGRAFSRQVSV